METEASSVPSAMSTAPRRPGNPNLQQPPSLPQLPLQPQRIGKQLPQKLWRQQLQRQQQMHKQQQQQQQQQQQIQLQQKAAQQQNYQRHERHGSSKHVRHHARGSLRRPAQPPQSVDGPPSTSTSLSANVSADGRPFAISSTQMTTDCVFRSLNSEPDEGKEPDMASERHTPGPTATTPKSTAPNSDRPGPPLCSSRGRVTFGEYSWTCDTRKEGDGATASTTTTTAPVTPVLSSPAGTPAISSSSGSLRAAVFRRPGGMLYSGGGANAGASTASARDASEGLDKGGRPKPWKIEVPPNIPRYVVPPPGRRFGGMSKGGAGASGAVGGRVHKSTAATAPTAPTVRFMDFNPWRGRHAEDRLNETTVRNGHFDRLQNSNALNAETSTARGAWLPTALRRHNSTVMLGHVLALASVLARERSQIGAASQFKLPPRVTVTDTRRETWLRDLTNAAIPLRKLSRTIPHGLRGKVLLDQCLLKAVPVDRAMWLARCVGAQELRAFKRKGSASVATLAESELRWLKDWTTTAQLFLEAFLSEPEALLSQQSLARERLQYATRFARQLYVERLLDHEQFLSWMLAGLRQATRSPSAASFDLWLFVVDAYFDDIMQRRRTSVHLSVSLLMRIEHYEHLLRLRVPAGHSVTSLPILTRPRRLLERILCGHPDTFVCQALWPCYEELLATALPDVSPSVLAPIRRRNAALEPDMSVEMDQAVHMLLPLDDVLRHPPADFAAHFADFVRLDRTDVVAFVIRWCASIHRPGLAKVYVAARLVSELCGGDARLITDHVLAFLSSDRRRGNSLPLPPPSPSHQRRLHVLQDRQPEGNTALYHLVGLLTAQDIFLPGHYLAWLILQSRPSDPAEIGPDGRPQVRLAAELPVALLDRPTANLRSNTLRRLGYDTTFEADDTESILQEVATALQAEEPAQPQPQQSFARLARCIGERSRNVKMAVAAWLDEHVVAPLYREATSLTAVREPPLPLDRVDVVHTLIEKTDDLRLLADFLFALAYRPQSIAVLGFCADTISLHLSAFIALDLARRLYDQVMGRALAATISLDVGSSTAFQTMLPPGMELRPLLLALPALAEKMPPPDAPGSLVLGVESQPLRLVPKTHTSAESAVTADEKHYEAGPAMAAELQRRLADMDQRLGVATYDADCSPVSDGQPPPGPSRQSDEAADEVREEMAKMVGASSIDSATMDRLFGTIAMITQERWRQGGAGAASSTDHLRLSASLFARLRRFHTTHFDSIMVKWLKRLRTMRDRPAIATIYPIFVVFGCLDLASLLATTADEQPREPGGPVQSPARNTWRTGYLQDVLALLSTPLADRCTADSVKGPSHPMLTSDEHQRFRLFLHEAPLTAPAGIAALVRNAVAEMTQWRRQASGSGAGSLSSGISAAPHGAVPPTRSGVDALAVSRLLRTAAMADATAAAHALARTNDPAVRGGLWEMTTLALTRKVTPNRPALDMLRDLDVFAADMGQLALGLAVLSPGPSMAESDGLAGLVLRAVAESQLPSLHVLHSLPPEMATSLKDHAQARFLDLVPSRKQPLSDPQTVRVASGFLDIVRTIMLSQLLQQRQKQKQRPPTRLPPTASQLSSPGLPPAPGLPGLDASIVDRLGELWCLLQEHKGSADGQQVRHGVLRDWLPALLSLILLHLPNREAAIPAGLATTMTANLAAVAGNATSAVTSFSTGFGVPMSRASRDLEQEAINAGACIALASLHMDMAPLADSSDSDSELALQSRLLDTALLLADGLSDDTRQLCVRTLRELSQGVGGTGGTSGVGVGDLAPEMAFLLSCPSSGSIYYPQLYLERLPPMLGRPGPSQPQQPQQPPQQQPSTGQRRMAGPAAPSNAGASAPDRSRRVRFGLKTWDAVSDPSPAVQDNDTAVNLWLLEATKTVRQRRR